MPTTGSEKNDREDRSKRRISSLQVGHLKGRPYSSTRSYAAQGPKLRAKTHGLWFWLGVLHMSAAPSVILIVGHFVEGLSLGSGSAFVHHRLSLGTLPKSNYPQLYKWWTRTHTPNIYRAFGFSTSENSFVFLSLVFLFWGRNLFLT